MSKAMSRKNRSNQRGFGDKIKVRIREETSRGVFGVAFAVLAIFFILSALSKAGVVGEVSYRLLGRLFGYGYFLLPLLCALLAYSAFQNLKRKISGTQIGASLLFFLTGLGTINLFESGAGGIIGRLIGVPLVSLFDVYAAGIILAGFLVISFLIAFDTSLRLDFLFALKRLFRRKEKGPVIIQSITEEEKYQERIMREAQERAEREKTDEFAVMPAIKKLDKEEAFISLKPKTFSLSPFTPPPLSLLERDRGRPDVGDIKANANIIKRTLQNFGIPVEMDEVSIGPSVTRYALKPAEGVKLSRIMGLQNNLELALAAHPVRIEAPIPGKSLVGIEIPNQVKTLVGLGSLLSEEEFQTSDKPLLIAIGRGISGKSHFGSMAKMPHLLVAGATGSGKSVSIHAIIASLLYRNPPENLKFIMIDPKRVELTLYNGIPHLLTPVLTDPKKAILALKWIAKEMDRRYDILEECSVRDIESYHKNILEPEVKKFREKGLAEAPESLPETMPYIVIILDELADIMQTYPRELESAVVRLAQMSRAVGIHLILSTQRPSVNVITGLIKANIPARIALQVISQVDSRTILDSAGAEKLLGAGDMLYLSGEMSKPQRLQSAFISEGEVKKLVKYVRDHSPEEATPEISFASETAGGSLFGGAFTKEGEDDLYEEARQTVVRAGKASTSYLQRKLGVGYARAARLMDMLEERGVVGAGSGAKPREVLVKSDTAPTIENSNDGI
ncbi:DNA translocase FtsK [Patescibacteria group bacterium]|nr:MAG: DNA translocase FtsK [Patescibacteria group bacterium]